jgi:hypothetical protein
MELVPEKVQSLYFDGAKSLASGGGKDAPLVHEKKFTEICDPY